MKDLLSPDLCLRFRKDDLPNKYNERGRKSDKNLSCRT